MEGLLLRESQFSNTVPQGGKPITYFSSQQRGGKAEKLPKRQCLEFGVIMQLQPCLGQDCGILCLSKHQQGAQGNMSIVRSSGLPSIRTYGFRTYGQGNLLILFEP